MTDPAAEAHKIASAQMDCALFHAFISLAKLLHKSKAIDMRDLANEMESSTAFAQAAFGKQDLDLQRALAKSIREIASALAESEQ